MADSIENPARVDQGPRSRARRILSWVVGVVLALVILMLLMRVFIRPIPPTQPTPPGHFGEPCALCHLVVDDAAPVDVR